MSRTLFQALFVVLVLGGYYLAKRKPMTQPPTEPSVSLQTEEMPKEMLAEPIESNPKPAQKPVVALVPEPPNFQDVSELDLISQVRIRKNLKKHFEKLNDEIDKNPRRGLQELAARRQSYVFVREGNPEERYLLEQSVLDHVLRIDDFGDNRLDAPSTKLRDDLLKSSVELILKNIPDKDAAAREVVSAGSHVKSESLRKDLLQIYSKYFPTPQDKKRIEDEIQRVRLQQEQEEKEELEAQD
jgi:hypothetical protein